VNLRFAAAGLLICLPVFAAPPLQTVELRTTDRMDLAPGGALRLANSSGEVAIEAWDQPAVEISLTRTTFRHNNPKEQELAKQSLGRIHLTLKKNDGGELEALTTIPSRQRLFGLLPGFHDFHLYYRIRAPRDAKLIVDHNIGTVTVSGIGGDIEARVRAGDIVAQLPGAEHYSFDTKVRVGDVYSDFEGKNGSSYVIGQRFVAAPQPPSHRIVLRVGVGGISIQRL